MLPPASPAPRRSPRLIALVVVLLGLSLLLCSAAGLRALQPLLHPPTVPPPGGTLAIVSDLPLSADASTQPIVRGMQLRLEQAHRLVCGGQYALRYESWDDASAASGNWDPALEAANARQAAADPAVIAYLGPYNSGAAKLSIPILDRAGPLAMVSLGNTYSGLTKRIGAAPGEPDVYYPIGIRNYTRLTLPDDVQGAVAARFVRQQLKASTVYILDDQQPYGLGVADAFETAARTLGLTVLGRVSIDPNAPNYQTLMGRVSLSNAGHPPDAIFAGMLVTSNASQLLKDKVALMGDNARVKYVGTAGIMVQAFIDGAGRSVAEGVYASQPGLPFSQLPPAGLQFKRDYEARYGGHLADMGAVYGYEAMNVTLAAIESVCAAAGRPTSRRAIRDALFNTHNFPGVLGTWSFDANGDITLSGATFYQITGGAFQPLGYFQ